MTGSNAFNKAIYWGSVEVGVKESRLKPEELRSLQNEPSEKRNKNYYNAIYKTSSILANKNRLLSYKYKHNI